MGDKAVKRDQRSFGVGPRGIFEVSDEHGETTSDIESCQTPDFGISFHTLSRCCIKSSNVIGLKS